MGARARESAVVRYLVTGGTGFVGRHLLPRLAQRGSVALLVRDDSSSGSSPDGAKVVWGDVASADSLGHLPDAAVVYHMAAMSFVPDAQARPVEAFEVNVRGTLNMLEHARRSSTLERFVFLSSGHVYGPAQYSPIDESHPLEAANIYGATKLAAERMVKAYHDEYGLPTTILRTFNVYGPGQSPSFLVPTIIDQLLQGKPPILGDGRPVRDFTYIDDFVDLLVLAGERSGATGGVFNVGTGVGTSVKEVVQMLMQISGVEGEPTFSDRRFRKGEIMDLVVSNDRLRAQIGWEPNTPVDVGLRRTWLEACAERARPA